MYDFKVVKTASGAFEVEVTVPNAPRIVLGMEFDVAASKVRFSAAEALAGRFQDLSFDTAAERDGFTRAVGAAILRAKGEKVCCCLA